MCSRSLITKCNCRGLSARTLSTGRPTPNSPNLRRGAPKPLPRTGGTQPRFGPFSVCGFLTCRHLPLEHVSISQTRVRASTTLLPLRKRLFRRPSTMSRRPSYTFSCRTKKTRVELPRKFKSTLWISVPRNGRAFLQSRSTSPPRAQTSSTSPTAQLQKSRSRSRRFPPHQTKRPACSSNC